MWETKKQWFSTSNGWILWILQVFFSPPQSKCKTLLEKRFLHSRIKEEEEEKGRNGASHAPRGFSPILTPKQGFTRPARVNPQFTRPGRVNCLGHTMKVGATWKFWLNALWFCPFDCKRVWPPPIQLKCILNTLTNMLIMPLNANQSNSFQFAWNSTQIH